MPGAGLEYAKAHSVLNEFIPVRVPNMATLATSDEDRCPLRVLVVALGVRVRSAWNDGMAYFLELP